MKLGWTKLLPLALFNVLVTGAVVVACDNAGPGVIAMLNAAALATQAIVACGAVVGVVAVVTGLLEPRHPHPRVNSSASRFACEAGGTKATPQQA